ISFSDVVTMDAEWKLVSISMLWFVALVPLSRSSSRISMSNRESLKSLGESISISDTPLGVSPASLDSDEPFCSCKDLSSSSLKIIFLFSLLYHRYTNIILWHFERIRRRPIIFILRNIFRTDPTRSILISVRCECY
ncbi:hypothetical protein ALC62_01500, partial [Cyphomyrmex costatus]